MLKAQSAYKGIVSVGTKFHAPYTADALFQYNMLNKFIAGKRFENRTKIPDAMIMNISLPHYIGALLRKLPLIGHKLPYNIISDKLFDVFAKNKMCDVDFFIGFNNYSLDQMKKSKNKATLFLEQRIAHVQTEQEIYIKEFGKLPSNLSSLIIKRKLMEYELADYILVPSQFVFDSMVSNGIPEEKLILIPYGYDPGVFYKKEEKTTTNEGLKVVFVGQVGFRKGIRYLLEAVHNLQRKGRDIQLTLAGNIDNNVMTLLESYKDSFIHKKFVPQKELVDIYNESDLFILPSLCEGSALVTYEAAACGLPLIVTHNTGTVVTNNHDGIIVESGSTKSIEEALEKLYFDRGLLKDMKFNISNTIKEYTWDKYAEKLVTAIVQRLKNL
ncbi:glycosyltransferase family 4 protein [Paenibacillus medicaginis]|uniref:Glycosyltransferase family 4 protein n=1 Tax=Paenibacillus medicaginis TaxID=1470560 RepID=A0ABV5BYK1_9BACL